jgi:hypothetical protein
MITYRPNPAAEDELQTQTSFHSGMRDRAKLAAASVVAVAPKHTGYYARHVKAVGDKVVAGDKSFWHLVEYGSINNAPYRPLTRGIRAIGMRFVPLPKHS